MTTTPPPSTTRIAGARAAQKAIVLFVAWAAVVGGFYLWKSNRSGHQDLGARLISTDRRVQQEASIELAARIKQKDTDIARWYPQLLKMTDNASADIRGAAAWIMGSDPVRADFHQALLKLSKDPSPAVRANAAVSLGKGKDPTGRQTVLQMLRADAPEDEKFEGLRALKMVGTPADLPLTDSLAKDASNSSRIRDAAQDAARAIKYRE